MEFIKGEPTTIGVYLVRVSSPRVCGYEISYTTMLWRPGGWRKRYSSDEVTHYAIIKEPRPLYEHEEYADIYGRIECIAQQEILPDLSTPPGKG